MRLHTKYHLLLVSYKSLARGQKFWIKACALSAMATGSRALLLLCKKTRFLPGDVTRLVREYLRLHVGGRCPAWIDDLLWQHR